MIELGKYNLLKVVSVGSDGAIVTDGVKQLSMPKDHCDERIVMDAEIELFVYRNGQDQMIATTHKPKATVGQFAPLRVLSSTETGAFLDWGMDKDLFVPHSQQVGELMEGKIYVFHILHDDISNRTVATARLRPFLKVPTEEIIPTGTAVKAMVIENRENGSQAIVRGGFKAHFGRNEFAELPKVGRVYDAFAKRYNDQGQLTISRAPVLRESWGEAEQKLITLLENNNDFLPVNDHSTPAAINAITGMSKKSFKKVVGGLFRQRKITIKDDGIELNV